MFLIPSVHLCLHSNDMRFQDVAPHTNVELLILLFAPLQQLRYHDVNFPFDTFGVLLVFA